MAHVLLIDDDDLVREFTEMLLQSAGLTVTAVDSGRHAAETYRLCQADLVITDLVMPGVDGLDIIQTLCREFPGVKVIAMSGGVPGGKDILDTARELGAAAGLDKPFDRDDLLSTVWRVLRAAPA